jgi:hypothetical protein
VITLIELESKAWLTRLFGTQEYSNEGLYTIFIQNSGKLESILIDEKVPVENEGDNLFILEPYNHEVARQFEEAPKTGRFGSPKQKPSSQHEVEIWPQVLAKGMAKNLGCYERLLNQDMANTLSDITGMPVKTLPIDQLEFRWLRENYKLGSVLICKANSSWISKRKRDCTKPATDPEMQHWAVSQVIALTETKLMVEVKNHFCDKIPKISRFLITLDWSTDEYLQITEDWMKYKRFKKIENSFWISFDEFKGSFESVVCSMERSNDIHKLKRLEYKNLGLGACSIEVTKPTSLSVCIAQLDSVICPKDYEYTVIRSFLVKENTKGKKDDQKEPFELIKSAYHPAVRDSHIDVKLEKGRYKLLLDIEPRATDYAKFLNLNYFSNNKLKITTLSGNDASALQKSILTSLAIRRGQKTLLNEDGSVRKYILEATKLGLQVHVFANRASHACSLAERLSVPSEVLPSRLLEEGDKLVVSLPPNSLKLVTYRHALSSKPPQIKVLEASCLMK